MKNETEKKDQFLSLDFLEMGNLIFLFNLLFFFISFSRDQIFLFPLKKMKKFDDTEKNLSHFFR